MASKLSALWLFVGLSLVVIGANADAASPSRNALTAVAPSSADFAINGTVVAPKITARAKGPLPKVPTIYRWIKYSYFECRVDWDQRCEGGDSVHAPPGYQVCNFVYTIAQESGGNSTEKSFEADDWYTGDPQRPPRFRAFKFHIGAWGSGIFYDRSGAWIRLENVGITYIDAEYDNDGRYLAGCNMPVH